jgi:UrcA family protein
MTSRTASSITGTHTIAAAFAAFALSASASFAQIPAREGEVRSVTVQYGDLNLASEAGSRTLYDRLVVAARQVCPAEAGSLLEISQNLEAQRCIDGAVERAVKEIRNPKFAEVATSRMR